MILERNSDDKELRRMLLMHELSSIYGPLAFDHRYDRWGGEARPTEFSFKINSIKV